jgi:uncharacterized protein (TIGR02246 family)
MRRLVLLSLFIAAPLAAQTPTSARDSIAAAMRAYVQTIRNNDPAALMGWWTDDGVYMGQGAKTAIGRAALDSLVRSVFGAMRFTDFTEHTDEILVDGSVAVQWGSYVETVQPKTGAANTFRHRYLLVWRRQPTGGWKVARAMSTDLPEPKANE